jgi:hypothetical protein
VSLDTPQKAALVRLRGYSKGKVRDSSFFFEKHTQTHQGDLV